MNCDRRDFMRRGALALFAGCTAPALSFISGCSKENGVSPFLTFSICENTCIGCGDCAEVCEPGAIVLGKPSTYTIRAEKCNDCGKCQEVCEPGAIRIAVKDYVLHEEKCIGCGKCVEVCVEEGGAIGWEKEYYTVRGNCKPHQCGEPCVDACPENAISFPWGKAIIDMEKCTRCGKCVDVCPYGSINPAHVEMDVSKCTHCGECYEVCEYDALEVIEPEEAYDPILDMEKCTQCGKCVTVCDQEAIDADVHAASILPAKCTACELCVEACEYDAVRNYMR